MAPPNKGPFLRAALLCENVVEGKDGRLTIVNVIDQVKASAQGTDVPDEMPPFRAEMKAVVALRAGSTTGRYAIKLRPEQPDGTQLPAIEIPVQFPGREDSGVNTIIDFAIDLKMEGVYWIDVLWVPAPTESDELLTRVPLRVAYQPQKIPGPQQIPPPT